MLKCIATGEVFTRTFRGREGRPDRSIQIQRCLYEQGVERRLFNLELGKDEAPLPEGAAFDLVPEFSVNQYGDLEITRNRKIVRRVAAKAA